MKWQESNTALADINLSCYPFGVGNNTEGVAILLEIADYRILLDCGLQDINTLLDHECFTTIDWVFCSHAHIDHACSLRSFHEQYPEIPIYASEVTSKLLPLNWLNSNDHEKRSGAKSPLYPIDPMANSFSLN